jgi:hypothetical protein
VDALLAVEAAIDLQEPAPGAPGEAAGLVGWELGARAGATLISGAQDVETINGPGGGPDAEAVFHLAWFFDGVPSDPADWMAELQLGGSRVSTQGVVETIGVAALQLSHIFNAGAAAPYVGANIAYEWASAGGATSTDWGWGVAAGYRYVPLPHLALRAEARYRHWTGRGLDELGIAVGFGVVIP